MKEALIENRSSIIGTRNEFLADVTPFELGSDHDDYDAATIAVPSLYLRDWPDIYIHTDHDSLEQIDPTKLRRVAALGAASGYVYATLSGTQLPFFAAQSETRLAKTFVQARAMLNGEDTGWYEARNLMTHSAERESAVLRSIIQYCGGLTEGETQAITAVREQAATFNRWLDDQAKAEGAKAPAAPWADNATSRQIPVRTAAFGPVENQYDDALMARLGATRYSQIQLLNSELDQAGLYAYEILNFVDGKHSVGQIRDSVSAEFGPIDIRLVADYLNALNEAKIISLTN
jgi:hypothetical protein